MKDFCPLFSVITVSYNAEACIAPTLESVAQQTCQDYEHVIIDGASSDATLDIVSRLRTDHTVLYSERDAGIYDGMNKGLRIARGRYVVFLNAGDTFASADTLAAYMDAVSARPDIDIVYGDTVIVDQGGRIIRPRHLSVPEILTHRSFSYGMLICHQAFMVRRSIAPSYDLTYHLSSDYDWTIRCIRATVPDRCHNLRRVVVKYLDNGASEKHKLRSLRERFRIMAVNYGWLVAIERHISFIPRVIRRRIGIFRN